MKLQELSSTKQMHFSLASQHMALKEKEEIIHFRVEIYKGKLDDRGLVFLGGICGRFVGFLFPRKDRRLLP